MYKDKKILGIIPARGGSKGLPRKNILPLLNKPLVAWTIEQALRSKYLDKVIASTDDQKIVDIARQFGAEAPFIRPEELARDDSLTIDVAIHALNYFEQKGNNFDYLALLEPTSPLREMHDIDRSIKKLIDNEAIADSLISVGEIALEHPFISKKIDGKGYVKPFCATDTFIARRQELPKAYFPYGVMYLSKVDTLKEHKTFYQEKTIPYLIERWQNYEIDDDIDLMITERVLKENLTKISEREN